VKYIAKEFAQKFCRPYSSYLTFTHYMHWSQRW